MKKIVIIMTCFAFGQLSTIDPLLSAEDPADPLTVVVEEAQELCGQYPKSSSGQATQTYYVNVSDPKAGDDLDGSSSDFVAGNRGPWRSLRKALETMEAGDVTLVSQGVYQEKYLEFRSSGEKGRPIVLTAAGLPGDFEEVLIDGAFEEDGGAVGIVLTDRNQHIVIQGLTIQNMGAQAIMLDGARNNTLCHNTFTANGHALILHKSTHNLVYQNKAHHNRDSGFVLDNGSEYNRLVQNEAWMNTPDGFTIAASAYNTLLANNSHHNKQRGFNLESKAEYNDLRGNTAHNNVILGFSVYSEATENLFLENESYENVFHGFVIIHNSFGNKFTRNHAHHNTGSGFYFEETHGNELIENIASYNKRDGFTIVAGAHDNLIKNNQADHNAKRGFFWDSQLTENNFLDNTAENNRLEGFGQEHGEKIDFFSYTAH